MHMEEKDVQNNLQRKLRGQLLFFGITMGLLAEIINSRFFTNVWDSFGLTYDVSFELNLFDRLKLGWYVISVTSTPGKAKLILLRYEAEIKSNAYWLGLLGHLQAAFVPRKDISCIKDLIPQYEAASIEDLAYDQLKVDENSLCSCVGILGAQAGNEITSEDESHEGFPGVIPMGRVLSTMSRPAYSMSFLDHTFFLSCCLLGNIY